ncbi:MAG: T9SS type A sorting domain-containing protein, partial [Candidatus Coatesbacteria bacterium]
PAVPQICLAPNGDVYITYYDFDQLNLHLMKNAGTKWTHRVLASGTFAGYVHSMDIGNADYPQVIFYNATSKRLRWAYFDETLGVDLASFAARRRDAAVEVRWNVTDEAGIAGYNLYRSSADEGRAQVNPSLITGTSPYRYRDAAARADEGYEYWLEVVLVSGGTEEFGPASVPPAAHAKAVTLYQNSPNPASGTTTFSFELPAAAGVTLAVYDAAGRKVATVADGHFAAGRHDLPFEAGLPAGVYLYRLETAAEVHAKKMVVASP